MTPHITPKRNYYFVYAALLILTATTAGVAEIDLGQWNVVVALLIAGLKASLVVWFFMHVNHSSGLMRIVAGAGLFWLAIFFTLTFSDYISRNWIRGGQPWQ